MLFFNLSDRSISFHIRHGCVAWSLDVGHEYSGYQVTSIAPTSVTSSQKLNTFVLFSLITSEMFKLTHRYGYQFVGEVMTDM